MTKDDDTAALIAEAKIWLASGDGFAPTLYVTQKDRDIGPLLYRLTAALERATADAARMREALQMMLHIEPRDLGHVDTIRAYQAARAALEPRP